MKHHRATVLVTGGRFFDLHIADASITKGGFYVDVTSWKATTY